MADGGDRTHRIGDADRQAADEMDAFIAALRAGRQATITNADRDADKKEVADLRAKTEMLERAASRHAEHIREQRRQIQTLTAAVSELQRQGRPAARITQPARKRDGLDAALERELYD